MPKLKAGDHFCLVEEPDDEFLKGIILEVDYNNKFYIVYWKIQDGPNQYKMRKTIDVFDRRYKLDPKWLLIKEFNEQLEEILK